MSNVLLYDPATGNGIQLLLSVNTPDYEGKAGALINPDKALIEAVAPEYLKVTTGVVSEMTAAEKAAVDAAKPLPEPDPLIKINADIKDLQERVSKLEKP